MREADIETVEQTLNNYLFEHMPEYHVIRYHNQLRLFIEPIEGGRAAAQYIHIRRTIRTFYVNSINEELERVLRVFCLLHDLDYSNGRKERGLADDENYSLRP